MELNHLPTVYKTATLTDELQAHLKLVVLRSDWLSMLIVTTVHRQGNDPCSEG